MRFIGTMIVEKDRHQYQDLIALFNGQFKQALNTVLVAGDGEPLYQPANSDSENHQVIFAHGFYASALHEIAHWCVAGEARRQQLDYGYWYCPDGRDAAQQAAFEKVEIKPQAIEWGLAAACGFAFNVSSDNLNGVMPDRLAFQHRVHDQVLLYLQQGFPARAQRLIDAFRAFYQRPALTLADFDYRGMYER
ncbi:elongation factor P hydroxylase [Corallincola holothuriorum]|uniref:Elongation factor P hydroxylase n=2 Tax=Corallincola holothuriorum TaxID=2282215 RepID=A0A368NE43_9GAMM|nr:elongation factor P hydroxylase [Corallincola holothuriorum]